MKPSFQKDAAFLADVRRVLEARIRSLWWLGQSGFLIAQNSRAVILDPYLSDSLTRKYANTDKPHTRITERVVDAAELARIGAVDAITSSHNHTDHLDAETLLPPLKPFTIDIALLPINGDGPERRAAGNLDGRQAAKLAKAIGARIVIPCHFDLFEFNTATPDEFIAECRHIGQKFELLQN